MLVCGLLHSLFVKDTLYLHLPTCRPWQMMVNPLTGGAML